MTASGQICKISYTAYCNTYCNMGQPHCNILRYTLCCIASPLILTLSKTCLGFHMSTLPEFHIYHFQYGKGKKKKSAFYTIKKMPNM